MPEDRLFLALHSVPGNIQIPDLGGDSPPPAGRHPLSQVLLPLLPLPEAIWEPGQGSPGQGAAWGGVWMPDPGFPRPRGEGSGCLRAGGGLTTSSLRGPATAQGTRTGHKGVQRESPVRIRNCTECGGQRAQQSTPLVSLGHHSPLSPRPPFLYLPYWHTVPCPGSCRGRSGHPWGHREDTGLWLDGGVAQPPGVRSHSAGPVGREVAVTERVRRGLEVWHHCPRHADKDTEAQRHTL